MLLNTQIHAITLSFIDLFFEIFIGAREVWIWACHTRNMFCKISNKVVDFLAKQGANGCEAELLRGSDSPQVLIGKLRIDELGLPVLGSNKVTCV